MLFSSLIFYFFIASIILVYGVGIKELLLVIDRPKNVLLYSLKTFLTTTFSVMLSWVVTTYILAEKNLTDIYPFFLLFITLGFSILFSYLIKLIFKIDIKEFSLTFLISLISINESVSFFSAISICVASTLCFYILIPILYSIKKRISISSAHIDIKTGFLILFSIALFLIVVFSYNISWLNFEV